MRTADELKAEIKSKWRSTCLVTGLMYQRSFSDRELPQRLIDARHYAIRLSRHEVLSWHPVVEGNLSGQPGCLKIEPYSDRFSIVRRVNYLPEEVILKSILASCHCFHNIWKYCIGGWNCEHWARLVSTGKPISYQTAQKVFGAVRLLGGHFRNPDAVPVLHETLRRIHLSQGCDS